MSKLKTKIQKWLEVEKPTPETKVDKDLRKEVDSLRRDLDFWRREFKKRQPTKKCTKCKQPISLWPFEDTGYYIKGNRVTHTSCKPIVSPSTGGQSDE